MVKNESIQFISLFAIGGLHDPADKNTGIQTGE
jgi:hypothetical protein